MMRVWDIFSLLNFISLLNKKDIFQAIDYLLSMILSFQSAFLTGQTTVFRGTDI